MFTIRTRGFTLIELLVVIAIIGILAALVTASLSSSREKSRDAARKSQLAEIQKALELYYLDHNTYRVSGGGSGGSGNGWFSYRGGAYTESVGQQLANLGYIRSNPIDPSGADRGNQNGRTGYMIFVSNGNGQDYTLWANLEAPTAEDIATQDSCRHDTYDNYHSSYPTSAQTNYCVSS